MIRVFVALVRVLLRQHLGTLVRLRVLLPLLGLLSLLVYLKPAPTPEEANSLRIQGCASAVCCLLLLVPMLTLAEDPMHRAQRHLHHRLRIRPLVRNLSHFSSWVAVSIVIVAGSFLWLFLHPGGGHAWGPVALRSLLYGLPWIALLAAFPSLALDGASRLVVILVLLASIHGMLGLTPLPYDGLSLHPATDTLRPSKTWPSSPEIIHSMLSVTGGLFLAVSSALVQELFSEPRT